jgi:uncharacterized membrane protein YphA (DoxX/SURF4 family)
MNLETLIIVLGAFFVLSGIFHFINSSTIEKYAVGRGLLNANIAVKMSGVLLIGAGIVLIAVPKYHQYGFFVLAGFHFLAAVIIHRFWEEKNVEQQLVEGIQFMKNLIIMVLLIGFAITI